MSVMRCAALCGLLLLLLLSFPSLHSAQSSDVVTNIPDFGPPVTAFYAGHALANSTYGSSLYYQFHASQNDPKNDPIVVWLQGGPGCSSMIGAWTENGPYLSPKNRGEKIRLNPYAWNRNASLLYFDSPPGTGFSFTNDPRGYTTNELQIADDLFNALLAFFAKHPELKNNAVFITGESYAGKYVPYFAHRILYGPNGSEVNLKGVAEGNGWTDPQIQMKSYVPYLKLFNKISAEDAAWAVAQYPEFDRLMAEKKYAAAAAIDNRIFGKLTEDAGINDPYNIMDPSDPTAPYMDMMTEYLNRKDVQEAFHTRPVTKFEVCSSKPFNKLNDDEEASALSLLAPILAKIPITLYEGEFDLVCDWVGVLNYTNTIQWPGRGAYHAAPHNAWNLKGKKVGDVKTAGGLSFVRIANAGHMSPFDQPEAAFDLITRIINNDWKNTSGEEPEQQQQLPVAEEPAVEFN